MRKLQRRSGWVAAGLAGTLLLAGCTDSTPDAGSTTSGAPPTATAESPVACDSIQVRDVDAVAGDWVLAETVLIRDVPGTEVTVDLPADAPAKISVGTAPESGASAGPVTGSTESTGLTIERATVATTPATDLDPTTLQEAIGQSDVGQLSLTNAGQAGFTGQLAALVGADGTVVYRGAREVAVSFAGDCAGSAGDPLPVTGTARYFELPEAGALDCGTAVAPGTLADAAARSCPAE